MLKVSVLSPISDSEQCETALKSVVSWAPDRAAKSPSRQVKSTDLLEETSRVQQGLKKANLARGNCRGQPRDPFYLIVINLIFI